MQEKKTVGIIISIFALFLGIILIKQAQVSIRERSLTGENSVMQLAYEIITVSNSNFNLQNEINRLRVKNDTFSFDIKDKAKIKEDLEGKLENYKVINGASGISGKGVEIKVDGGIITEEIVDLINGIRNTKPKAIGINNKRVIYSSSFLIKDAKLEFDNRNFNLPFTVQVIGDIEVLRSSLNRSGGILDVIRENSFGKAKFEVKEKDNITLPAYEGKIALREAKIVNY